MKQRRMLRFILVSLPIALALCASAQATTSCKVTYGLEGWSVAYKTARGTGTITCADGQSMNVRIVTHGGGLTVGTQGVKNGTGRFSQTVKVEDLLRTYIEVTGHAGLGANKASEARAMFAGTKRLSLAGNGSGVGLGLAVGAFVLRAQ